MRSSNKGQRGSLLIVTLIGLIVLSLMGFAFLSTSNVDLKASGFGRSKTENRFVVESGLEKAVKNLKTLIELMATPDILLRPKDSSGDYIDIPPNDGTAFTVTQTEFDVENYAVQCFTQLFYADPPYFSEDVMMNSARTCMYYATIEQLSQGLDSIRKGFDVTILDIEKVDSVGASLSLEDDFNMPDYANKEEYSGLNAKRRMYKITMKADSTINNSSTTIEANISVYVLPMFQWLYLSDDTVTFLPGQLYNVNGRIHSNKDVRAATQGGPINFSPMKDEFGNIKLNSKAITATGNIWRIFKIQFGGQYYSYRPYLNTSGEWRRLVRVEASDGTFENFHEHIDNGFDLTGGIPDLATCGDQNDPDCWVDNAPSGDKYYALKLDSDDASFNNRLNADNDYLTDSNIIYPPKLRHLREEDKSLNNNAQREVIEPGVNQFEGIPYDYEKARYRKWEKADIRVLRCSDGNFRSFNSMGGVIDSGAYSYTSLKAKGIIIEDDDTDNFYLAPAGRIANTITFDVDKLKTDPTFTNINHVYIGSIKDPEGEMHYPDPACTVANSNAHEGFAPICVSETGGDCITTPSTCTDPYDTSDPACVQAQCDKTSTGKMDTLVVKNGSSIPTKGLTISSNLTTFVQGDFNTDKTAIDDKGDEDPSNDEPRLPSASINCDMISFLSNSWNPGAWDTTDPTGPPTASSTQYNLAYMSGSGMHSGMELPLIESWSGRTLNRNLSVLSLWRSKNWPPSSEDGSKYVYDWFKRAYRIFYTPAQWNTSQDGMYAKYPPPDSDDTIVIRIQSIEEIEDLNI